jgi:thioredoxin 1
MAEITVTTGNFEEEVLRSDKPVLVDFWASWCGPCKMLAPVLSEIAEEYEGKIKVGKVNVDEQPSLAAQFRVASIPMLVLFRDGQPVNTVVGYRPKNELLAALGDLK